MVAKLWCLELCAIFSGTPCMWMKTILQQYPKSSNLSLNEATNVTEYRPL